MADIHSIKDPAQRGVEHEMYCAGQGYGECTTNWEVSGRNLTVTLTGYKLVRGFVSVSFSFEVPSYATLNINSQGAKSVYHNGSTIGGGIVPGSSIAVFYYDGTVYNLVSYEPYSMFQLISNKVNSVSASSTNTQYPSAKCVYDLVGDIESLLAAI